MVNGWVDGGESVEIRIDGEAYRASWVFDSRYKPAELHIESKKYHHLMQHFRGWEIETIDPVFDPAVATLFDLRTAQLDGLRFFYILPFSQRRALIEYTIFSQAVLPQEEYEQALSDYIQRQLSVKEYQIMEVETGIIPMTDYSFPRRLGQRVLSIGTLGGRVKPSTGYAFSRIQRDTQAIVKSLVRLNHPFDIPSDPRKSLFYDSLMLDVMVNHPDMVEKILTKMFSRNPIQRAIEFLDERTQIWEDILLIASLPPVPFLRALGNRLRF
jgi:lycopene beta-cyclase